MLDTSTDKWHVCIKMLLHPEVKLGKCLKVVRFIDENPWVKPLLARIQSDKNRGGK